MVLSSQGVRAITWESRLRREPMRHRIALHQSEEGFSVSVPALPGCWSQGATEPEALENIKDAIREYLAVSRINVDPKVRSRRTPGQ